MLFPFSNSSRLCPTFLPTQHYVLFLSLKTTSKTSKKPTHTKIPPQKKTLKWNKQKTENALTRQNEKMSTKILLASFCVYQLLLGVVCIVSYG